MSIAAGTHFRPQAILDSSGTANGRPFLVWDFSNTLGRDEFSLLSTAILVLDGYLAPALSSARLPPRRPRPDIGSNTGLGLWESPVPPYSSKILADVQRIFVLTTGSRDLSFSRVSLEWARSM